MGAAAAPAPMRRPVRPLPQSPGRGPRVSTPNGERSLRVVMASRRRRLMRRARIGLIAVALAIFGIIWVGVAQLRLTTKSAAVERHQQEVQAQVSDLRSRLHEQKNLVSSRAASELGMVSGETGAKAALPVP